MKTIFLLGLTILASSAQASNKVSNLETAKQVSISLEEVEYSYLGKRFDLQVISVVEKDNKVKVELGIGTTERPVRMHDCITVTFTEATVGYIQNIEKDIDSDSCEF
jgi:hypothetical protein